MDPNATVEVLLQSFEDDDRETALESLAALTRWIESGGYMPATDSEVKGGV